MASSRPNQTICIETSLGDESEGEGGTMDVKEGGVKAALEVESLETLVGTGGIVIGEGWSDEAKGGTSPNGDFIECGS